MVNNTCNTCGCNGGGGGGGVGAGAFHGDTAPPTPPDRRRTERGRKRPPSPSHPRAGTRRVLCGLDTSPLDFVATLLALYATLTFVAYVRFSLTPSSSSSSHAGNDEGAGSLPVDQSRRGTAGAGSSNFTAPHSSTFAFIGATPETTAANRGRGKSIFQNGAAPSTDPLKTLQTTFPIHVGENDDVEVIRHPGLAFVEDEEQIPPGMPRTMTVPMLFEDAFGAAFPGGSVRDYLGDRGRRVMTPGEAAAIGSYDPVTGLETIYCSVASYRDEECRVTVEDLYARASHPDRIRVAIIDQHILHENDDDFAPPSAAADGGGGKERKKPRHLDVEPVCGVPERPCDEDPDQALCKYGHLIDGYTMDARMSVGPVFARHLAHRFYRGEYFAMQIDSHVRFVQGWDDDVVGQWKAARNEMAVLSTYPADLNGSLDPVTHQSIRKTRPIMCATDFDGQGQFKHLRHGQQPEGPALIKGEPTLEPLWGAGFSFARGHFVVQVPYDQYLPMIFQGEEISLTLRGFTYGYDYYTPERNLLFHMYGVLDNKAKREKVPRFWENSGLYKGVGMKSMKRLNKIIGMYRPPPGKRRVPGKEFHEDNDWVQDEKDRYGLGQIRRTMRFFRVFGIHPVLQTVEHHLCRFAGKRMMEVFTPALRENRMGIDYGKIDYVFVDLWKDEKPNETKK